MWSTIISLITSGVLKVVHSICSTSTYIFKYLIIVKKDQIQTKKEEKRQEQNKKIDEVCDKGSLEDLIDLGLK